MIGYTLVGANDLEKAKAFYDDLFGAIGVKRLMEFPTGGCAWGADWTKPMFGVGKPYNGEAATFGNGTMIALVLDERAKVDSLYDKAISPRRSVRGQARRARRRGPAGLLRRLFPRPGRQQALRVPRRPGLAPFGSRGL